MKRTTLIPALVATLMTAVAINGAASAGAYRQTVEGSIAVMMGETSTETGCFAGNHRRVATATQEQVNGIVGYHFDVDKRTWNKPFRLKVTGPDPVDVDIIFYRAFGEATDPLYEPETVWFQERNPDGEFGKVPKMFNKAIVCMLDGVDVNFIYTAGTGVKR